MHIHGHRDLVGGGRSSDPPENHQIKQEHRDHRQHRDAESIGDVKPGANPAPVGIPRTNTSGNHVIVRAVHFRETWEKDKILERGRVFSNTLPFNRRCRIYSFFYFLLPQSVLLFKHVKDNMLHDY